MWTGQAVWARVGAVWIGVLASKQCIYNVALRGVRAAIVAVEKQDILQILSVYL